MREIRKGDVRKKMILVCDKCGKSISYWSIKNVLSIAEKEGWQADEETNEVFCPDCAREKDEEEQREYEERKQDERILIQEMSRQQVGRRIL